MFRRKYRFSIIATRKKNPFSSAGSFFPSGRADALGKLGISYGLGMIVGPFLGGLITSASSEETAAATAAVGSLISAALVLLFIPSNTKELITADTKKQREDDGKLFAIFFFYINVNLKVDKYSTTFCAVHSRNRHDVIWFWL